MPALQCFERCFSSNAKGCSGEHTTANFCCLFRSNATCRPAGCVTEDSVCTRKSVSCTEPRADQDLVEVLPVVGRSFLRQPGCNTVRNASAKELFLRLFKDRAFNAARAHGRTDCAADRDSSSAAGRKSCNDCGGHGPQTLSNKIDRSNTQGFDCAHNLIVDALILGVFHNAGDLGGILAGLR